MFVYRVFVPAGPFWPDRGPRPVWLSAPLVVGLSRPDVSSPFGALFLPLGAYSLTASRFEQVVSSPSGALFLPLGAYPLTASRFEQVTSSPSGALFLPLGADSLTTSWIEQIYHCLHGLAGWSFVVALAGLSCGSYRRDRHFAWSS